MTSVGVSSLIFLKLSSYTKWRINDLHHEKDKLLHFYLSNDLINLFMPFKSSWSDDDFSIQNIQIDWSQT